MQRYHPSSNEVALHIHVEGQVQGVGFRPFVWRLAHELELTGWVSNQVDGVHIEIEGDRNVCRDFCRLLISNAPAAARIIRHEIVEIEKSDYADFEIRRSAHQGPHTLLVTPDLSLCPSCKEEIKETGNRRHRYPFTTCTHCGPRYSIIKSIPYDRANTTMNKFHLCNTCGKEYNDVCDRRFYAQTNSCPDCAVTLFLMDNSGKILSERPDDIISQAVSFLNDGKIVAMKGIGGYLLLCDATHTKSIETLRERKHRPAKPFAVLYPSLQQLSNDVFLSETESDAISSSIAPIVLLSVKSQTSIAFEAVAPHLTQVGGMLPYTPLMVLLAEAFGKPMVATSGNEGGSPIFFRDEEAIEYLNEIADYFIMNNRDIVIPQDDSVVRFTRDSQRIIIRRSRGMAPTYFPHPFEKKQSSQLAMGSDLKSTFALYHEQNVYASQYLGDLENFKTQQNFEHVLDHWFNLLKARPQKILIDKHPSFFSSQLGRNVASRLAIPAETVPHHEAHFAAVLAENDLLNSEEPVLGVIWDGTGFGDDKNVWGGEFFVYSSGHMDRVAHLDYFDHILGDKFSREPRLAALSLFHAIDGAGDLLRQKFTAAEWDYYNRALAQGAQVKTSSVGRLFDAVASMLGLCDKATYEGEAAMYLESLASQTGHEDLSRDAFTFRSMGDTLQLIVKAILKGTSREVVAWQFHRSLVDWVEQIASAQSLKTIAFSGGVFQNALLVQLLCDHLSESYKLKFHKQSSPNDECISIGQLAWSYMHELRDHSTSSMYSMSDFQHQKG